MLNYLNGWKKKKKGLFACLISAAGLIGLDQWTKALAVTHLKGQQELVLIKGILELRYLENRGAAFGMFQGRQFFFFLVALVVFGVVLYGFYRMPFTRRYFPMAACMVLLTSGAVGNMIDRIKQQFVVDFIYFRLINFPVFNVADCYVTIAAFLLIILVMWYYKDEELSVFQWKKGESS